MPTELLSIDPVDPAALEMNEKIEPLCISSRHQVRIDHSQDGGRGGEDPSLAPHEIHDKIQPILVNPTSLAEPSANDGSDGLPVEEETERGSGKEVSSNSKRAEEEEEEEEEEEMERVLKSRSYYNLELPPPISTIGKGGRPRVYLKAIRGDGRLVLKKVRVPKQQYLHAIREDGRLRLYLVDDEEAQTGNAEEEEVDLSGKEDN